MTHERTTRVRRVTLLLVVVCCLGLVFVFGFCSVMKGNRHAIARDYFRNLGVIQTVGFSDPFGPNFIYTGNTTIPSDERFSPWFRSIFCLNGHLEYWILEKSLSELDFEKLGDLYGLISLRIRDSRLPEGWAKAIAECKSLRRLELGDCTIPSSSPEDLSHWKLQQIEFYNVQLKDIDFWAGEFSKMRTLKILVLKNSGFDDETNRMLERALPNCDVFIE